MIVTALLPGTEIKKRTREDIAPTAGITRIAGVSPGT
jgi:hypothetical protein